MQVLLNCKRNGIVEFHITTINIIFPLIEESFKPFDVCTKKMWNSAFEYRKDTIKCPLQPYKSLDDG